MYKCMQMESIYNCAQMKKHTLYTQCIKFISAYGLKYITETVESQVLLFYRKVVFTWMHFRWTCR